MPAKSGGRRNGRDHGQGLILCALGSRGKCLSETGMFGSMKCACHVPPPPRPWIWPFWRLGVRRTRAPCRQNRRVWASSCLACAQTCGGANCTDPQGHGCAIRLDSKTTPLWGEPWERAFWGKGTLAPNFTLKHFMDAPAVAGAERADGPPVCPGCNQVMKSLHGIKVHQALSGCGGKKRRRRLADDDDDRRAPVDAPAFPDFSKFTPPNHKLDPVVAAVFTQEHERQLAFCYSYVAAQLGHEC